MTIEDSIKRLRDAQPSAFAVTFDGRIVDANMRVTWQAADALMQHLKEIAPIAARTIQPLYAIERATIAHLLSALDEREALRGWRFQVVSDGDVRAYAPEGESWLVRAGGDGFDGFAHRLLTTLAARKETP